MYSSKFARLAFGLLAKSTFITRNVSSKGNPLRSLYSWTVCQHHRQNQLSNGLTRLNVRTVSQNTVDPAEVRKFQAMASKWWDLQGEFAALHSMNELRVPFIRDNLLNVHGVRPLGKPLTGLRIMDVGCGGGLLSEPLGRLGADVLGIDPVEDSVRTAELHSSYDPELRKRVRYQACSLEDLAEEEVEGFHAVVASEVVEHLADLDAFASFCQQVLKPGGSLFITTINKTKLSYVFGIVAAEQLLRIIPSGTHDWDKFISPEDLERLLESFGFYVEAIRGMMYNPLTGAWSWQQSTAINYALHAVKPKEEPQPDRVWAESENLGEPGRATSHSGAI
ncbi:ubiquinone biosynthesis O-methyltransferase, mitochondrial [Pimephales promelas]|uniref:ubiquinone biosynthesis O-methyltransferase, mitochondrial n=1 Tax=Pimephales promelas TaxID=90988 RepID=UPI00195594F3|nr:ubiquinone biosynthesis O-methyltransferase, mitochondrial [Pimephales promelas]KAG1948072.1 ubiquinone biosynthesis O-methyltransferase, mitochondrial [Pimephales promelas]